MALPKPTLKGEMRLPDPLPGVNRCMVYLVYGRSDELLYIGITGDLLERLGGHSHDSAWMVEASRVEWQQLPSRQAALAVETHLIETLEPLHNVIYNGRVRARDIPPPLSPAFRSRPSLVPPGGGSWTS